MVHLSKVTREPSHSRQHRAHRDAEISSIPSYENVYGMRYATEDLPSHVMNWKGMPAEVASRMISDELSLDGNPLLKCVPFFFFFLIFF